MIFFISPTNKSHKMDFFGEKTILEESNEPSLIKVRWLALYDRITHCARAIKICAQDLHLSQVLKHIMISLLFRFNVMGSLMGEDDDDQDQDSIKEAFLETNFYLLVMTFVVSILHTIFEFLAFKNGKHVILFKVLSST